MKDSAKWYLSASAALLLLMVHVILAVGLAGVCIHLYAAQEFSQDSLLCAIILMIALVIRRLQRRRSFERAISPKTWRIGRKSSYYRLSHALEKTMSLVYRTFWWIEAALIVIGGCLLAV